MSCPTLRIIHTIYDHPLNPWLGGGGAVRAVTVNRILASRGHHITMVCGPYPGCPDYRVEDGYVVRTYGSARSYHASRIAYALFVRKVFRDTPCDLVVDDTSAYSFSMPYVATKAPRIAIVHHLFGKHLFQKNGPLGIVPFVFERLNLMAYRNFIVGSPSVYEQVKSLAGPHARVEFIPYGVDDYLFEATPTEGDYILYFGRIDIYNKGLDTLLEAYERFHYQNPGVRLLIAGGGKDEDELRRRVAGHPYSSHIQVLGRKVGLDKRQLLEQALFVCMPSRYEGWGIVALESAACGKAVIASDIPGLRDAVLNKQTGILVPVANPVALADAMTCLATNHNYRHELAARAKQRAKEFRWEEVARRQEECYVNVVHRRKTASPQTT